MNAHIKQTMKWWREGIIFDVQVTTSYFLCEGHLLFCLAALLQGGSVVIHRNVVVVVTVKEIY